jgi:hypothetical protein
MAFSVEYHKAVRHSTAATLGFFGVFFFGLLLARPGSAQIGGGPAASVGSGSHGAAVAPPTMSISPPTRSIAPPTAISTGHSGFSSHASGHGQISPDGHDHHHHRSADGNFYYPYIYGAPVPYGFDGTDAATDDDGSQYQGGPTVFDRRGSGADSYIPPTYSGPAHPHPSSESGPPVTDDPPPAADLSAETPQPSTILVFKDGHQIEVGNYAIVGQTLYDLTPSHSRKVALAGLDLSATQKENEDRGVTFELPPSAQAN